MSKNFGTKRRKERSELDRIERQRKRNTLQEEKQVMFFQSFLAPEEERERERCNLFLILFLDKKWPKQQIQSFLTLI